MTEPLACENPRWPPIHTRFETLTATKLTNLIAWAKRLGKQVDNKGDAIDAILSSEYGEEMTKRFSDYMARPGNEKDFYLKRVDIPWYLR
jgi:hypothetical protein